MSKEIKKNIEWNKLLSFPFKRISQPHMINNDEFIIAAHKKHGSNGDGIYKFNIHKNEWIKIFNYDNNGYKYLIIYSTTYDNKNKLLYVCIRTITGAFKMIIFDLETQIR